MKNLFKITVMMMICFFIGHTAFADVKPESLKGDKPSTDIIIEVSGPQNGVWTAENLYHVIGDVSVSNGDTLIIEPGVIIKFMAFYSLIIEGALFASGTETDSICFTSGQPLSNPGDWSEIKFEDSSDDNSIISFTIIKYAEYGIHCNKSSPTICNNYISNNDEIGINCYETSCPLIANNIIIDNYIFGIRCFANSSPIICYNTVSFNGNGDYWSGGIYCGGSYNASIISNTINNNNKYGIYCYGVYTSSYPTIDDNIISNNTDCGIRCEEFTHPTISNNLISNNGNGIFSKYISSPSINNNTIINNVGIGISSDESNPIINNNTISNNEFGISTSYSYPSITDNTITNNNYGIKVSSSAPAIWYNEINDNVKGIFCEDITSNSTINNNIISNNANYGIYCYGSSFPLINKNTITNSNYGIQCHMFSSHSIINNIYYENNCGININATLSALEFNLFWENNVSASGDNVPVDFGEIVTVNANEDPCDIYYNLFMDPIFVDPGNSNFYILENSPCIDAGNPDPVYWDPDETIADIGAFYYNQSQVTQQISLSSGFSFVSSHIIPDNPDMLVVVEEILNENLDFIRNSQGHTIRKIGPNWVNGIGDWIVEEGYLVKMNAADSFTINGTLVDPATPVSVEEGFQFVSYFPETPMDALLAFETIIGDDLDFIRDSEGTMIRKIGPNWVNGIGDCQSGEGYLIKMFAEGAIIYPDPSLFTCGYPFTDPRNEQIYNTVQIGNQCWMAENLNIGGMISGSLEMTDNGIIEKYCYNNHNTVCIEYGGLYQWDEVMQYINDTATQGICPAGWYIPTDVDWTILTDFLGGLSASGGKMKETGLSHCNSPNTGATNVSGFTAFAGGFRDTGGDFSSFRCNGAFWSSTVINTDFVWYRALFYNSDNVGRNNCYNNYGFSVRCLKDNSINDNLSIKNSNRTYDFSNTKTKNNEAVNFIFEGGNPAEAVYTLYIKGLEIGDEVAAYDGDNMVGTTRINSQNAFDNELPVFSTLISGAGYEEGNPVILKVWSGNNIVSADFTMESIYDSYVSDVYPDDDGKYSIVNITKGSIENKEETISIYPNPSKGIINISIEGICEKVQVKVYDVHGNDHRFFEINKTGNFLTKQLDLKEFAAGVYFISFNSKDYNQVEKIVIQ